MNLLYVGLVMSLVKSLYSDNTTFHKVKSRKIIDGKVVDEAVGYMVYITKAEKSETQYDAWICGGVIVSKDFIVTSAACVEDVQYMYAISGYSKYVNVKNIDTDKCTKASKKKIVFICVPQRYDFAYDKIQKWAFIDIAAVKVESPYDFSAPVIPGCSWKPSMIDINYEARYQVPDTDAIVLGWGHAKKWRSPNDPKDYNQEDLQYSSIRTMDKAKCKELYSQTPELIPIIEQYMICAMYEGNLNIQGEPTKRIKPTSDGCPPGTLRVGDDCKGQYESVEENTNVPNIKLRHPQKEPPAIRPTLYGYQNHHQNSYNSHPSENHESQPSVSDDQISFEDIILNLRRSDGNVTKTLNYTRKAGICQNDHGGPLLTWVGKRERLIGVASVFRLDSAFSCVGPYLFTSTQCNGGFLDCVINGNEESKDTSQKDSSDEKIIKKDAGGSDKKTSGQDSTTTENPDKGNPKKQDGTRRASLINGELIVDGKKLPCNASFDDKYFHCHNDTYFYDGEKVHKQTTGMTRRREFCDLPPEKKGFDVIKRRISWKNHPDGPAENELPFDLFERPVKPIAYYG